MRSLAKSFPYYLVSNKKQLFEISHLPCSEEFKAKFTRTKTIFQTSEVEYKVSDFDNYDWKYPFIEDSKNCNVTQINRLSDGNFYITKRWV